MKNFSRNSRFSGLDLKQRPPAGMITTGQRSLRRVNKDTEGWMIMNDYSARQHLAAWETEENGTVAGFKREHLKISKSLACLEALYQLLKLRNVEQHKNV
jgi:hypothetical protein